MSESLNNNTVFCSFVSIHYIICECGETFPNEDALKTHLETELPHKIEKKEYSCGLCDEAFLTDEECIRHHQKKHAVKIIKPPSPPPVKYVIQPLKREDDSDNYEAFQSESLSPCTNIKKEFEDDKCMIVTSGKHPGTRKKKYVKKNIKNRICEVCGKKYASNAALRYHQRIHTGERPYQCNYCDKAFTMPLFLQIHHRIHTGEKPYQCPHCPKAFGNKAALLRHDRVHTGAKPYACPQCCKSFSQSNSMKLHVHTVHLRLPAPYKSKRRRQRLARLAPPPQEFKDEPGSPEEITLPSSPERLGPRGLEKIVVTGGPNTMGTKNTDRIVVTRGPHRIAVTRGWDRQVLTKNGDRITVPRGVKRLVVPRGQDVVPALPANCDGEAWTLTQQVPDGLPDICVVKSEEEFTEDQIVYTEDQGVYTEDQGVYTEDQGVYTEDQGVFYDHESSQGVLYEVVYEQE